MKRPPAAGLDTARPAPRTAAADALGLLARREHSAQELAAKLDRRGHSAAQAKTAIEQLQSRDWQSDVRFAQALARRRAGQGYGPLRIRAELKSHGLESATIEGALGELEVDWQAQARAQLRRHGGAGVASPAGRARLAAFLLRRGFDAATVRAATRIAGSDHEPGLD